MAYGWLIEFILEAAGAIRYRKTNRLLSFILAFCALTDALASVLKLHYSATAINGWYAWGQFALKELFLVWLACAICGVAVKQKSVAFLSSAFISLATCAFIVVFAFQGETLKDRLLDGEISATTIMLIIIAVAWVSKLCTIPPKWKIITLGFAVMVGGDFLLTLLWKHWNGAEYWQQIPTLAGYLIWCVGPLRAVKLPECRADLAKRYAEVERVTVI